MNQKPWRLLLHEVTRHFGRVSKSSFQVPPGYAVDAVAGGYSHYYEMLSLAQPFIAPPDGDFGIASSSRISASELRPPFPITALEIEYPNRHLGDTHRVTHAIVLILDMWDAEPTADGMEPAFGVSAVYKEAANPGWSFTFETVLVFKSDVYRSYSDGYGTERGRYSRQLPGFEGMVDSDLFQPVYSIFMQPAMHFLFLLTCNNVSIDDANISRLKLEREKEKHKSRRWFVYKTLKLPDHSQGGKTAGTGTHASPRFHVRRGHIRRLPSGRNTWVKAHTVGSMEQGVVVKDYLVQKQPN